MAKSTLKIDWLGRVYIGILLVIFGGIVLHAPFSVGFSTLFPNYELFVKSWKEILLGAALLIFIILLTKHRRWNMLFKPLFIAIAAFAVLNIALIPVFYTGAESLLAGILINLRYLLFFVLVYGALNLYPQYSRLFVKVFIASALVVIGFAALQLTVLPNDFLKYLGYNQSTIMPFLTVDQNINFIRINSTLRGPNPLGAYILIVLVLLMTYWLKRPRQQSNRQRIIIGILGVGGIVAIWATYSRSAVLGVVIAVGIVLFVALGKQLSKTVWVALAISALVIGGSLITFKDTQFVSTVILHEDPQEGNAINSNDGHADSLVDGTRRVLDQPLGGGIGSTGSASLLTDSPLIIENQYLFIAHESGWLGLILFVGITALLLAKLWRGRRDWFVLGVFSSGVALALIGVIQPVWVDETVSLIWWGLAAIALVRARGSDILLTEHDNKKQKH
jgi:hypothetical protein